MAQAVFTGILRPTMRPLPEGVGRAAQRRQGFAVVGFGFERARLAPSWRELPGFFEKDFQKLGVDFINTRLGELQGFGRGLGASGRRA